MPAQKPDDSETVWIEYPEGKHFQAEYDAASDTYAVQDGRPSPPIPSRTGRAKSARTMTSATTRFSPRKDV